MTRDPVLVAESLPERAGFRVLLRAAKRDDHRVFVNLGYAYDVGRGVRKSKAKALRWYRRAFERGDASAANNIGTIYRDRGEALRALRWFRRAVALGASGSNVELGKLLLGPFGSPGEALSCFRSVVASEACEADVAEAAALAAATEQVVRARTGS
jgi:TPR repeat protein